MVFEDFKFNPHIMAGVRALGYSVPTPIQEQAIPPVMQGHDIIGLAQTGTGKTAAFVLPILQRLYPEPRGRIRALIISPTRELADQTNEAVNDLGRETGLRSIAIYGGVGMDLQNRKLRSGVEIVVACPGRLLDHLWKGTVDLGELEVLVIDEADRMFDMGFLPDIRNIMRCIMRPRQTLLFSATMPPDIRRLVQEVLTDPVTVQIGQSAPAKTVSHALYPVPQHLKATLLMEILRRTETESVLIFTRTKHRTERIARQLQKAGFKATSLQGDLAQNQRRAAIDGFRDGYYKILVATDIAARGIDVLSISHVINFDMPESIDAYIHRIGRTGRVEKSGSALTFITSADAPLVKELERVLKTTVERCTVPGFNYSTPETVRVTASQPRQRAPRRTFRTQAASV
jgi:ATP-dependent RNA helicase RhlE